jgi:pimeloyl-ACP methyl ester carboxylesterase
MTAWASAIRTPIRIGFNPVLWRSEVEAGFTPLHQALGLDDFVMLGHSVGGGMAAMVAAAYGRQCQALITESAQSFVEDRTLQGISAARDNFAQPGQLERLPATMATRRPGCCRPGWTPG